MAFRYNIGMMWSFNELKKLINDENSCVHFVRAKKHIALHPFQLNDLNKALHEILSSTICFYDSELKGLLLAYRNPKLLSSLGSILYDSHFIHVDIEADFYVFKPNIGSILSGIVNKQATNHIGILVHTAFNVSIRVNEDDVEWQNQDTNVGLEVEFRVTHVDFTGKLPFITGKLLSDSDSTYNENNECQLNDSTIRPKITIDSDPKSLNDEITKVNTTLKSTKRASFLASVLNQTDSSSEDEPEILQKLQPQKKKKTAAEHLTKLSSPKKQKITLKHTEKKSPQKREKNILVHLEEGKKQINNTIEFDERVTSTSKVENSCSGNVSDNDSSPKRKKHKLKYLKVIKDENLEDIGTKITVHKSTKVNQSNGISLQNIKIKPEPDASDIENSVVQVKQKPIIIKTEVKNSGIVSTKRKYKEENKNSLTVKCESNTLDSDTISVPKKKIKITFSE